MLEKVFHLKANRTDAKTEIMAGITTALVLLAVIHVVITHYKNRKKDGLS